MCRANGTWPSSIKKEFTGSLHKFLAQLVETANSIQGRTVLYIPEEDVDDPEKAAHDKDLVQRLDYVLIQWTRQIKEVVSNQDNNVELGEDAGPLDEIEFWQRRSDDLNGISAQLNAPGVAKIVDVLEQCDSDYLELYREHSNHIRKKSEESQRNLQFLSTLSKPCKELQKAAPDDIPKLLSGILNSIRLIWGVEGALYSRKETLTDLLRKVSNDIIKQCVAHVDVDCIFRGDVAQCARELQGAIDACGSWHKAYNKTAKMIELATPHHQWDFEASNIFAQVDAFTQRCGDLLQVCEARTQFALRSSMGADKNPAEVDYPIFGGTRGSEIARELTNIEDEFHKRLQNLRSLKYSILDVKATAWHEHYNQFKTGIKELEDMMMTCITTSFESVNSVQAAVNLLEAFHHIANRDAIFRCLDTEMRKVFSLYHGELTEIKKNFEANRRNPKLNAWTPHYAGAAIWSKSLLQRAEHQFNQLDVSYYMTCTKEFIDAKVEFQRVFTTLEENTNKSHKDWSNKVEEDEAAGGELGLSHRLTCYLLKRQEGGGGLIMGNFDKDLACLFNEVQNWKMIKMDVPSGADQLNSDAEKYRSMQENIMHVVREYNNMLNRLTDDERSLFRDRIHQADKKISAGLNKLSWNHKKVYGFMHDARRVAKEVNKDVTMYHEANRKIAEHCHNMANTLLVSFQKKEHKVYEFEAMQEKHRTMVREKFLGIHKDIKRITRNTYEIFRLGSAEVQSEWVKYVLSIDEQVEDALRTTVKKSLQEISRSIVGDTKHEVKPIFKVNVTLEGSRVEYRPTMQDLTQMVQQVAKDTINAIGIVPRLVEVIDEPDSDVEEEVSPEKTKEKEKEEKRKAKQPAQQLTKFEQDKLAEAKLAADERKKHLMGKPSFHEVISNDDEFLRIVALIMGGMATNVERMQRELQHWDKYKDIWNQDKDRFMQRYAKTTRQLSSFDSDITRFRELQAQIQNEDNFKAVMFVLVEFPMIKTALVNHCIEWENKFLKLLNDISKKELDSLYDMFETTRAKLEYQAVNLDELGEQLELMVTTKTDLQATEERFEPLSEKYVCLDKFERQVTDEEKESLTRIKGEFEVFCDVIKRQETSLEKRKLYFKDELMRAQDDFTQSVADFYYEFKKKGPFGGELTVKAAQEAMKAVNAKLDATHKKNDSIAKGLKVYKIEPPIYDELTKIRTELDLLEEMWGMRKEWEKFWNLSSQAKFKDIDADTMTDEAAKFRQRVRKIGRTIDGFWGVWGDLKDTIEEFIGTMPLLQSLRDSSMRTRHWDSLKKQIGKEFDETNPDFDMSILTNLGLHNFQAEIDILVDGARKEEKIEKKMKEVNEVWGGLNLEIKEYKQYHKLATTEDINSYLDDHMVSISAMKASKFKFAFADALDSWEKKLTVVTDVIEMVLQVQRNWMYLENIFVGQDDIQRQLPTESAMFMNVNSQWKETMLSLLETKNCVAGCHLPGIWDTLNDMDKTLEKIQKSLDDYLEKKRQAFPRFYFLSNDELLEILGQAKDPKAVQPFFRKCFEGINKMNLKPPGEDGRRTYEADAMMDPYGGETVEFGDSVIITGMVESWMNAIEAMMINCMRSQLKETWKQKKPIMGWIKAWPGQLLITASCVDWTYLVTKHLQQAKGGKKSATKKLKREFSKTLSRLIQLVQSPLKKIDRKKLIALITIEVHSREVIEKLVKQQVTDPGAFLWLSQLRFTFGKGDADEDDCIVEQTITKFIYGYEYLGNCGRLVVTPLTDRCYMTLTNALHLRKGGNPLGPAGTGKTETVKDLAKNLAKACIVMNCSDGMDYKSIGSMFSGLAQSGAWSCFDEFNRIEVEVLSVVAQQMQCIFKAILAGVTEFTFEGIDIRLKNTCGIFVTMNPGYAGRSELPDNLKALLRPIAMMTPDLTLIVDISLISEGFMNSMVLAKKLTKLYELCQQQLSKQDHYDFGLRNIKSVLGSAGMLKRNEPDYSEDLILFRALRDMNITKFIVEDKKLFLALMSDLFHGLETPEVDYGALDVAIRTELKAKNLQEVSFMIEKAIQVYEIKLTRHGNMLVGASGSGKSTAWQTLVRAMKRLLDEGADETLQKVTPYILNPKAINNDELYGAYDIATMEWQEGILPKIMRECCRDESEDQKWLIFDGPVDTLWIESMNTVLDDNKLLTLINGERIALTPQVSLLFEVADLSVASPATVSRAGMIFLDVDDLGWKPFMTSWIEGHEHEAQRELLIRSTDRFVQPLLDCVKTECKQVITNADVALVQSLARLVDALLVEENGINEDSYTNATEAGTEEMLELTELFYLYACVWTIGGRCNEETRKNFDIKFRELETAKLPPRETVYDWMVDAKKKDWVLWTDTSMVPSSWRPDLANTPFYKITVPTVDTARNGYVVGMLLKSHFPVLMCGETGNGKSAMMDMTLQRVMKENEQFSSMTMYFSAKTASKAMQETIEAKLDKRGNAFAPAGGKKLIIFCDDFNMPGKDLFGSQPPLELLRLWMGYGFWYDRTKQTEKRIIDTQICAAMGPPGGARSQISERLQSRFNCINCTAPSDDTMKRIFGIMINQKLMDFDESFKSLGDQLTVSTITLYLNVAERFLPTPSKPVYLFNLRDVAKVFAGVLQVNKDYCDNRETMIRLWAHESCRVFQDRMNTEDDKLKFQNEIDDLLVEHMDLSWKKMMQAVDYTAFGDFMRESDVPIYEEITNLQALKDKLEGSLDEYNETPKCIQMNLVLFQDAIQHVLAIHRCLRQDRGSLLLVGVGGSGRQSLTRLAGSMCDTTFKQIEITSKYRLQDFKDDMKLCYEVAGVKAKHLTFIFGDNQIVDEGFLEAINSILSSGEIPGLYAKDEVNAIIDAVRGPAKKAGVEETSDAIYKYFIETARNNFHIVTCMSPVGEAFRNRVKMFPSLVNNTTIDWFLGWPVPALKEVAMRFLEPVDFNEEHHKEAVATSFAEAHAAATIGSENMLKTLKRYNYITPTHFLELVTGYRSLLESKRQNVLASASKLRNGLQKLDDSRQEVEIMSEKIKVNKATVEVSQKECAELLVTIVQERRIADDEEKKVMSEEKIISKDKIECERTAADRQEQLAKALPALQKAEKALEGLSSGAIAEVKQYKSPPDEVIMVMQAIMVLRKDKGKTWDDCKKVLTDPKFLTSLKFFDKTQMDKSMTDKVTKYTNRDTFKPEHIMTKSGAAASLAEWVIAMKVYGEVAQIVEPKKRKLAESEKTLHKKLQELKAAQDKLSAIQAQVAALQKQFDDSNSKKAALESELATLVEKLERANKIVTGLAGERERWSVSIEKFEEQELNLAGDVLVASSFQAYAGPFPSQIRNELVTNSWMKSVVDNDVPVTKNLTFVDFLASPVNVRNWQMQGLPTDSFSTENGVMVTSCSRWPLMIDPQGQANKWVKKLEAVRQLVTIDPKTPDVLRTFENCIGFGTPVLMQDILEEMDPALEPILGKNLVKSGGSYTIKCGDKDVDYNPEFRFYITTKLSNPHYPPEISTKSTIINFSVLQSGLEDQLLGLFIKKEKEELEVKKGEVVVMVATGKNKLVELEDLILYQLSTVTGSLIDNIEVCDTLTQSKITSAEVEGQLAMAAETEIEIDTAREIFRPVAQRASHLYFVLVDLSKVDPMYQFSLDAYASLFELSIKNSRTPGEMEAPDRIKQLKEYHSLAVYKSTCIGLFSVHKLLFSLLICMKKLMEEANPPKVNHAEYQFFLRGANILDRSTLRENPFPDWLEQIAWENLTDMEKLPTYRGLCSSVEQSPRDWKQWYRSPNPESRALPGDWNNKLDDFQRMVVLRAVRSDRVVHASTTFISMNIGPELVNPPVLDLDQVFKDSTPLMPLIFVLSTGADPTNMLAQLANEKDITFKSTALGQGQAPIAINLMDEGKRDGNWVFLANCHLMLSWLPSLEKIIEKFSDDQPHNNFRLWLSSSPHPKFPIAILQAGIKMTTEPPKGLKPNLRRLYGNMTDEKFQKCEKRLPYQRLLFSLCFFHSVLLERRKFLTLGWNILYEFNDSDFDTAELIVSFYLDAYDDVPWDSMKYLIAEATYGGRVTDDWDRRLLNVYMNDYFCDEVLSTPNYRLSPMQEYYTPDDGPLKSYKDYVSRLPAAEVPTVFGQHGNAEISSQISNSRTMLETLVSLQAQVAVEGEQTPEQQVAATAKDLFERVPKPIPLADIRSMLVDDPSPLNIVLLQESERYNTMLSQLSITLKNLQLGIKGLVVMSTELDVVFQFLFDGRVPPTWLKAYPSIKPLAGWMNDLVERIQQLSEWVTQGHPVLLWIGGLTFPTGYLTALLQATARKNNQAIDAYSWSFDVLPQPENEIMNPPKEGAYMRGMFLEGAGWSYDNMCLEDPEPMKLVVSMPVIHFKPVERGKRNTKGIYPCPLYMYPIRTGSRERPSYMITVELKTGPKDPQARAEYWTKRGTALMLALA